MKTSYNEIVNIGSIGVIQHPRCSKSFLYSSN